MSPALRPAGEQPYSVGRAEPLRLPCSTEYPQVPGVGPWASSGEGDTALPAVVGSSPGDVQHPLVCPQGSTLHQELHLTSSEDREGALCPLGACGLVRGASPS